MALLESLLLGFGIGLSGALAPGPTLLTTIPGAARHSPLVGGAALVGFGLLTVRGAPTATLAPTGPAPFDPFLAAAITSVANPYFWLWGVTLGGALLADALAAGSGDAAHFLAGHGAADLGWLLLVALGAAYTATAFWKEERQSGRYIWHRIISWASTIRSRGPHRPPCSAAEGAVSRGDRPIEPMAQTAFCWTRQSS